MNKILLAIVYIFHILTIAFIVIIPFTFDSYLLFLHSIIVPFLIIHWVLNDNTCVLTTIEKKLKSIKTKDDEKYADCFTCRLIDPIFDLNKDQQQYSKFIYGLTITLWFISMGKLYLKYDSGEITKFHDIFI